MPTPMNGEGKEDYVGRFMASDACSSSPLKPRLAIAYSKAGEKHEGADIEPHEKEALTAIGEHLFDSHHGMHDKEEDKGKGMHEPETEKKEQKVNLAGDVRFEGSGVLRYESAVSDVKPKIDRTTHMMTGVRGMNAKPTRKDYFYGLLAQKSVVSRYEGMVTGLNHDYKQGPPTIERSIGKVVKAYCDENGTLFDIQYNPAHERMEQILTDAETGLNTISISCICTQCEQHGNEVTSFVPAGVDFVVNAGQTTKMFEQVSATQNLPATPAADSRLEQALRDIDLLKGKLTKLEQVAPATVAADVQRMEQGLTQRGVNMKAFMDENIFGKKQ